MHLEASDLPRVRAAIGKIEPSVRVMAIEGLPQDANEELSCRSLEAGGGKVRGTDLAASDLSLLRKDLILIALAGLISAAAFIAARLPAATPFPWLPAFLYIAAWGLAGYDVILGAARNILRGRVFDELFLMGIATLGAILIGQYVEAVGVMVFYKIGEALQERAASRSRASVRGLLDLRPDTVRLRRPSGWELCPSSQAAVDEVFLVLPGERIPLDGIVLEGESLVDCQALTGEPRPRRLGLGDPILAGTLALDGALEARAVRLAGESSAARIAELVENASHAKAKTERFISRFARIYTPAVVAAAAILAFVPPLFGLESLAGSVYRALVLLVISCPCALVISVPLGYFGGLGGAARRGILIKGGTVLDALARTKTVVFDKTGTLTKGVFAVRHIETASSATSVDEVLELAAAAESRSRHPIAASIREAARNHGLTDGTEDEASGVRELPGLGVVATLGTRRVLVGNRALLVQEGIAMPEVEHPGDRPPLSARSSRDDGGTQVLVAANGAWLGTLYIGDEAKNDAAATVVALERLGVERCVILTGDDEIAGLSLGREIGIEEVHAGLLPEDKLSRLEQILAETTAKGGTTIFVGDGINDAPVLARADIGAAMGAGADVAIECADLVIMTDEPSRIVEAIERGRWTRRIVMQNIVASLAIKAVFISLGAIGVAVMWEAVIADVGVALMATLNATRASRAKFPG